MTVLYYIPDSAGAAMPACLSAPRIAALGLGHALGDGGGVATRGCTGGPPGAGPGLVAARQVQGRANGPKIGYYPANQIWRAGPPGTDAGGPPLWFAGFDRSHRPAPEDLRVETVVPGHWVPLPGDAAAHRALVPVIRSPLIAGGSRLPQQLDLDDSGAWIARPLSRYERLVTAAGRWWSQWLTDVQRQGGDAAGGAEFGDAPLTMGELIDFAAECLSINYRVTRYEIALLGWLTDEAAYRIAEAAIDVPGVLSAIADGGTQKKTDGASGPE